MTSLPAQTHIVPNEGYSEVNTELDRKGVRAILFTYTGMIGTLTLAAAHKFGYDIANPVLIEYHGENTFAAQSLEATANYVVNQALLAYDKLFLTAGALTTYMLGRKFHRFNQLNFTEVEAPIET